MKPIPEDWPQGLKDVALVIGTEAALVLAKEFGGIPVYIPRDAKERCMLTKYIGCGVLAVLAEVYGGSWLTIPRYASCEHKKHIVKKLLAEGHSLRTTAKKARVTVRYVCMVQYAMKHEEKQLTLF